MEYGMPWSICEKGHFPPKLHALSFNSLGRSSFSLYGKRKMVSLLYILESVRNFRFQTVVADGNTYLEKLLRFFFLYTYNTYWIKLHWLQKRQCYTFYTWFGYLLQHKINRSQPFFDDFTPEVTKIRVWFDFCRI